MTLVNYNNNIGFIDFIDYAYSPTNHDNINTITTKQRIINPNKSRKIQIFGKRIIKQELNNKVTIIRIKK